MVAANHFPSKTTIMSLLCMRLMSQLLAKDSAKNSYEYKFTTVM
jgi:hypothetical protein